jgi:hypothetical protein
MSNHHTRHHDDPALDAIGRRLDDLGASARGEPGAGFEARLARSTRPGVAASIDSPRPWSARWALPVAACLAVGALGLWLARSAPAPGAGVTLASLEHEIDDFLFVDALAAEQSVLATEPVVGSAAEQATDEWLFDLLEGGAS